VLNVQICRKDQGVPAELCSRTVRGAAATDPPAVRHSHPEDMAGNAPVEAIPPDQTGCQKDSGQ
jgi:hypothetical protein